MIEQIKDKNEDQDFFSAIKICKKKRIGPSRQEDNRPLFYKKDIGVLVTSVFPFFILTAVYVYLGYYFYISGYDFDYNFTLYLGLYDLRNLFEAEAFLIMFWTHFLAINLFCGAWIMKDSQKLFMSRYIVFIPIIITYFIGPLGLVIYWIIRMFYAKRINLLD